MTLNEANRKARYLQLCVDTPSAASTHRDSNSISAPLFSWSAREILHPDKQLDRQHALLGHVTNDTEEKEPVLLNTEHPWSAFICGSQGSGKSYTTSCILEGCLSRNKNIGTLKQPMAGLVFRYDRYGSGICEAATLCTGSAAVKVQILLSPFNYKTMESKYRSVSANEEMLQIKPFYLKSKYLNAERIQKFMASGDGFKPLYMSASPFMYLFRPNADGSYRSLTRYCETWVSRTRALTPDTNACSCTPTLKPEWPSRS